MLGFRSLTTRLLASALIGALLLVFADWIGRNLAYPWPMSAGLLSALIGGGWFLWLLYRRKGALP